MRSSISSSETTGAVIRAAAGGGGWRRFFVVAVATAVGASMAVYVFVALVDPWDILPLSPGWRRAPMSSNQRYSYAALARSPTFDSAVIGTSTSRLLRPADLDAHLGGAFVNLSMNAATPYEQSRMLEVFNRTHPKIKTIILGINYSQWCATTPEIAKYMYLNFPEWMYDDHRWKNYAHIFSLYAVQEAVAQVAYLVGLRPPRFGRDGYANFLPNDSRYDAARAGASLAKLPARGRAEEHLRDQPGLRFPALDIMRDMLSALPPGSRKIVFFAPTYLGNHPAPGSPDAKSLSACKVRVVELAERLGNTKVADFLVDSPITSEASNYWDPLHYRIGIAERLVADLARVVANDGAASADYRVLVR